jgi:hypothetical protein
MHHLVHPMTRVGSLIALSLATSLLVLVTACGGGGESSIAPPPSGTVERDIDPAVADPRITNSLQAHVAVTPSSEARANKLFVFLPGTGGVPSLYRLVLRSGAARGYHALGLNYPNAEAVGSICFGRESACFWDVRREVITGVNRSNLVSVNEPDSINTRLGAALTYLHASYPDEGWGQYFVNGSIDWSKLVVAGHSQGGGHAGVMAKLYAMNRAVYFSSPADWNALTNDPADWMSAEPNVTPASEQFAFGNVSDSLVPYDEVRVNWAALGLTAFGAAASVDGNVSGPFGSTHLLITSNPGVSGGAISPSHGSTVLDVATPRDASGGALFDPVWAYLCFP